MKLVKRFADYAGGLTFTSLPPVVVHEVKRRVLDSVACAYGAMAAPPCKMARRMATSISMKDGATVWGTHQRTTPDLAAFANGSFVRYLDFNDTYLSKEPAHPSDNIPACLSVAESVHATGKQLIEAILLAYEVQCRLCDAAALRSRGWDHVTYGAFSTALGAAKLLKLSKDKTMHAMNLAGITSGALRQTRVGEVSLWKACAFANSARNGIFAAYAAREGMTGPLAMFEGEKGFMKVISGSFSLSEFGGQHDVPFKILDTYIKPRPLEYHAQTAVEAALKVRERIMAVHNNLNPSQIASIEVGSFDVAIEIIGRDPEKWRPQTRETADHSLPYCVAVALLDGTISPQSFSPKRIREKSLYDLIQKVEVREVKEFTEAYPNSMPNNIQVKMIGGEEYSAVVEYPSGHPQRPLSDRELELKFHAIAVRKLERGKVLKLIDMVWTLETLKDVRALIAAMPAVSGR
ncbi:MAG: propanediol utilization protein [Nitrospirales bacterium]|nr:MAG: propanediol utilization protein [Nitrospirales bacterium]